MWTPTHFCSNVNTPNLWPIGQSCIFRCRCPKPDIQRSLSQFCCTGICSPLLMHNCPSCSHLPLNSKQARAAQNTWKLSQLHRYLPCFSSYIPSLWKLSTTTGRRILLPFTTYLKIRQLTAQCCHTHGECKLLIGCQHRLPQCHAAPLIKRWGTCSWHQKNTATV